MIYEKLFGWQKSIVDKFKDRKSFGLFLDMGLGKTPISLALAEQNQCTKIIIITVNPKIKETVETSGSWLYWANQSGIPYIFHTKNDSNFGSDQNDLLIINYEGLFSRAQDRKSKVVLKDCVRQFINSCARHNVALIIDESHKIKDIHSMQTMSINKIKSELNIRAKNLYTYLLTGTPFTTAYIDLYSQLKILGYPEIKNTFVDRYCIRGCLPGLLGWQQPIVGYKNVNELFELVHQYAITIESKEVIDLPDQVFVEHTDSVSRAFNLFTQEKAYPADINDRTLRNGSASLFLQDKKSNKTKINNPYYRDLAYDLDNKVASKWVAETTGNFWLRSRQLSTGFIGNSEESTWYDLRRLYELSDFLKENEDNYLLFYNYTPELLALYDICEEAGYNIDVYCGEAKSLIFYEKYASQKEEERLTNKKNIILANFASGSTGLNWQLYNKCIIFSLPLYKDYAQGIKRIHRTGQTKTVIYHLFYQNNWLDKSMLKALKEQVDYSDELFKSDLKRVHEIV